MGQWVTPDDYLYDKSARDQADSTDSDWDSDLDNGSFNIDTIRYIT